MYFVFDVCLFRKRRGGRGEPTMTFIVICNDHALDNVVNGLRPFLYGDDRSYTATTTNEARRGVFFSFLFLPFTSFTVLFRLLSSHSSSFPPVVGPS